MEKIEEEQDKEESTNEDNLISLRYRDTSRLIHQTRQRSQYLQFGDQGVGFVHCVYGNSGARVGRRGEGEAEGRGGTVISVNERGFQSSICTIL